MTRFYRSRVDSRIAGVCGGLSEMSGLDSLLIRCLFITLFFTPVPIGVFYLASWFLVSKN